MTEVGHECMIIEHLHRFISRFYHFNELGWVTKKLKPDEQFQIMYCERSILNELLYIARMYSCMQKSIVATKSN